MANPVVITKTLTAADADGICASQTPGAAGNLTIDGALASGGVATLDTQRRVLITAAGDESGLVFTIYGTNQAGSSQSENVTGPNATTATTLLDYKTVTRVAVNGAAADAITVGTSSVGASPWQMVDHMQPYVALGVGTEVSGTVNYTIQVAYEADPCLIKGGTIVPLNAFDWSAQASKSADTQATWEGPITAWRVVVNSGAGSVTARAVQGFERA